MGFLSKLMGNSGEFERNDMVEYFGECLDGYVFTEKAWVQSYGTRCVKPPVVWGDISRAKPMTVKWSTYAQSLTEKPVKGMLTGPVTILNWSFPREDISLKESAYQIALAIREEVLDLEASGIKIIQIDEAALREKLPLRKCDWNKEYLDWAIMTLVSLSDINKTIDDILFSSCIIFILLILLILYLGNYLSKSIMIPMKKSDRRIYLH